MEWDTDYQEYLDHFTVSVTKRKILREWRKHKNELRSKLWKDRNSVAAASVEVYKRLKPLLLQSFQEEYEGFPPYEFLIFRWLDELVQACEDLRRYKEMREWEEIMEFMKTLSLYDMIPLDEKQILI